MSREHGVKCHQISYMRLNRRDQHWCFQRTGSIDLFHKSYKAPVLHPTMHHFVTEMCTCVHISVTKWCIVRYICMMHCGICKMVFLYQTGPQQTRNVMTKTLIRQHVWGPFHFNENAKLISPHYMEENSRAALIFNLTRDRCQRVSNNQHKGVTYLNEYQTTKNPLHRFFL